MAPAAQPKNVLFVCWGNACRSQMAEALARHSHSDVIEAWSAGLAPLGIVPELTLNVLRERGISSGGQFSKGLHDDSIPQPIDLVVNMSGIPGHTLFAQLNYEDWRVEDPYGEDMETYRRICDDIEARLEELAARLRSARQTT